MKATPPVLIVLMLATTIATPAAMARGAADEAPFRRGEVVLAGSPESLPAGYEVVKYLPNADLTVVRVEPGTERAQAQALRAGGRMAGVNQLVHAAAAPNDEFYGFQWHFTKVQAEVGELLAIQPHRVDVAFENFDPQTRGRAGDPDVPADDLRLNDVFHREPPFASSPI